MASGKKNADTVIFMDETGFSEGSVIRRTWAPRGQTPILRSKGRNWKWMSAIGALAYRRGSKKARVLLLFHRGAVGTEGILRFLHHLRRHTRGRALLLWDGLGAHHSPPVREWLTRNSRWLTTERLPAYAPELNPVEGLWGWIKGTCLANVCTDTLDPLVDRVRAGTRLVRRRSDLLQSFLAKAGLSL